MMIYELWFTRFLESEIRKYARSAKHETKSK